MTSESKRPALPELLEKAKLPIDRPCSACSAGDYDMQHHDHAPPFSDPSLPKLLEKARDHVGAQPEPDERAELFKAQNGERMWKSELLRVCERLHNLAGTPITEGYEAALEVLEARAGSSPAPSPARTVCAECYEGAHGQCIEQGCYCNCQAENL